MKILFCLLLLATPVISQAHVSEQGFVLLMPTRVYIVAGVLAVLLTILALGLVPARFTQRLFFSRRIASLGDGQFLQSVSSLLSLGVFACLLVLGILGSRDPLQNPLPLYIWTLWWIGLVALQGLLGNLWYWINPWSGLYRLLTRGPMAQVFPVKPERDSDGAANAWPAVGALLLLVSFALVDPAPDDPYRLALIAGGYWTYTMLAMLLVGEQAWLRRGEFVTRMMNFYASLAPLGRAGKELRIGVPAWQAHSAPVHSLSVAVFVLLLLGCGSFDGLNETFWWLALIGVNPLEFPGRSAVIVQTTVGLIAANAALVTVFALCVWLGLKLAVRHTNGPGFRSVFTQLSVSMLPIAFAYHVAHYLTAFLVDIQYVVAASSDPLARGDDWLGLGKFYVTSGFLNHHHSVQLIWLTQAAVVVAGHVLSVMLAHAIAIRLFGSLRRALLSQLPLATFMIFYTFLGLWLLASPRGA